jgi:hypothetical protein
MLMCGSVFGPDNAPPTLTRRSERRLALRTLVLLLAVVALRLVRLAVAVCLVLAHVGVCQELVTQSGEQPLGRL